MYLSSKHAVLTASLTGILLLSGCKSSPAPPAPGTAPTSGQAAAPATAPVAPATAPTQPATATSGAPIVGTGAAPTSASVPPVSPAPYPAVSPSGTSVAKATVAPAPRPVIPAGSRLSVRITEALSSSHNEVGDGFTGVLNAPVLVRGVEVLRRGAEVRGTVVASKGRGRFKGAGGLGIELTSVAGYRVSTSEYERVEKGRGKRTAGFIGGGGGVGALIGGLAGGGKGALLGGLAGAGAGTAAGAYTGKRDVVIPSESLITFTTRSAVQVR